MNWEFGLGRGFYFDSKGGGATFRRDINAFTVVKKDGTPGETIDPQSKAMAVLKDSQRIGEKVDSESRDPISAEMAALSAAQAAGEQLKVDPQPAAITRLKG